MVANSDYSRLLFEMLEYWVSGIRPRSPVLVVDDGLPYPKAKVESGVTLL